MAPPSYKAGDILSFRTSPATKSSPIGTGRYAVVKVLGLRDDRVCFVVLDGIFDHHPNLAETSTLGWLRNFRFLFHGDPAWGCTPLDWKSDLEDLRYVGTVELSREDTSLLADCHGYGSWSGASQDAEGEWRWRNDRAAYQEEVVRERQLRDARHAAERERYEQRLKTLTWGRLLEERPFSRWDPHPPFPPPDFVVAARERIRSAILDLQALGSKPRKGQVRTILRACVEWFNAKDVEFGNVIETEEREDICLLLEELAFVARHRSLVGEIDEWRNW